MISVSSSTSARSSSHASCWVTFRVTVLDAPSASAATSLVTAAACLMCPSARTDRALSVSELMRWSSVSAIGFSSRVGANAVPDSSAIRLIQIAVTALMR